MPYNNNKAETILIGISIAMKQSRKVYLFIFILLISTHSFGMEIKNCAYNDFYEVQELYQESQELLTAMQQEVNEYLKSSIADKREHKVQLLKIKKTLKCIRKKSSTVKIQCHNFGKTCSEPSPIFAYTRGRRFPIRLMKNEVFLCPDYFEQNREYQAAVIIHEISHICHTEDHKYFSYPYSNVIGSVPSTKEATRSWRHPKTRKTKKTSYQKNIISTNADTYEYWALYGFCLPGYDCP